MQGRNVPHRLRDPGVLALAACLLLCLAALAVRFGPGWVEGSGRRAGAGPPAGTGPVGTGSASPWHPVLPLPTDLSPTAPPVPTVTAARATMVAQVAGIPTLPASILNPNYTPKHFQVYAADLGIIWDGGNGTVRVVFGDTFGRGWRDPNSAGPDAYDSANADWRCSTMAYSSNHDLDHGLIISEMVEDRAGHAGQLLPCGQGRTNNEETFVPTSGIHVGSIDYLASMSVTDFTPTAGVWRTNYSQISYSLDGGRSWIKSAVQFRNNADGSDHFQMPAFAQSGGYVYVYGTQNGRFGPAYLARVPGSSLLDETKWQYWTARGWSANAEGATIPVVAGPVGELSVDYDSSLNIWLMSYLNQETEQIVLRTAAGPAGPWSKPQVIADSNVYPGLYGGFIHPWSSGDDLYFVMSAWGPYQTYLMHSKLTVAYHR